MSRDTDVTYKMTVPTTVKGLDVIIEHTETDTRYGGNTYVSFVFKGMVVATTSVGYNDRKVDANGKPINEGYKLADCVNRAMYGTGVEYIPEYTEPEIVEETVNATV